MPRLPILRGHQEHWLAGALNDLARLRAEEQYRRSGPTMRRHANDVDAEAPCDVPDPPPRAPLGCNLDLRRDASRRRAARDERVHQRLEIRVIPAGLGWNDVEQMNDAARGDQTVGHWNGAVREWREVRG